MTLHLTSALFCIFILFQATFQRLSLTQISVASCPLSSFTSTVPLSRLDDFSEPWYAPSSPQHQTKSVLINLVHLRISDTRSVTASQPWQRPYHGIHANKWGKGCRKLKTVFPESQHIICKGSKTSSNRTFADSHNLGPFSILGGEDLQRWVSDFGLISYFPDS